MPFGMAFGFAIERRPDKHRGGGWQGRLLAAMLVHTVRLRQCMNWVRRLGRARTGAEVAGEAGGGDAWPHRIPDIRAAAGGGAGIGGTGCPRAWAVEA